MNGLVSLPWNQTEPCPLLIYKGDHIHSYLNAQQAVFILYVPLHYGFHNRFQASVVQNLLDDPTIGIIEQELVYKISNSGIGKNWSTIVLIEMSFELLQYKLIQ